MTESSDARAARDEQMRRLLSQHKDRPALEAKAKESRWFALLNRFERVENHLGERARMSMEAMEDRP